MNKLTTRQARKALKFTNQLVGPLQRTESGWNYAMWFANRGAWVYPSHASDYRRALKRRKQERLLQACHDLGIEPSDMMREYAPGIRAEVILRRAMAGASYLLPLAA